MNKRLIKTLAFAAVFSGWAAIASAQATDTKDLTFDVSAILKKASGFACDVKYQPASGGDWIDNGGNNLAFGELVDPDNYGWFRSENVQFFVCDLAPTGGVGTVPSLSFAYQPGSRPNHDAGAPYDQRGDLDRKGILTVAKVTLSGTTTSEETIIKKTFGDINGVGITENLIAGGWARLYFGLGFIPASGQIDPAEAEVFNASDRFGTYSGTVIATVTW